MTDRFIIFTPNPPSISILPSSGKQSEWSKIKTNLEKLLNNYKKNDYGHMEQELFDFIDKSFEEMNHSQFLKIVKKLIEKIKEEIKENNLKSESISFIKHDKTNFNLTFKNIFSLVNIMIHIIDTSKGKTSDIVYDFAYNNKIPDFKDAVIHKQQLSKVISALKAIQTIRISLYKENEDIYLNNDNKRYNNISKKSQIFRMDSKIVLFFSLFFKSIFKSANYAIIDLNIPPIDKYFLDNSNPYLINFDKILSLGDNYKDIVISNLLIIKSLLKFHSLTSLSFKMYDSYQIELHSILTLLLDNNNINEIDLTKQKTISTKTIPKKIKPPIEFKKNKTNDLFVLEENSILKRPKFKNNYLYIQHILTSSETSFFDFCLDFNSLDPLLFNSVNYLLTRFLGISKLNLKLFPKKKFNKRKIYMNNYFYNKNLFNNIESPVLYSNEDKKIYYQYLDKNDNNSDNFILKDEKLLNELFESFNENLKSLSIILEKKLNYLLSLSIDFSTHNNESILLCNYDNYNCSIICFIFDLFKTFELQIDNCKINSLDIFYDDFLDEKTFVVETIRKKIPSFKNGFKLNNLKLNHINFNISNISLILSFEDFPSINLTELILSNLSYFDLNNLVKAFKNNKDVFPILIKLDLSLGIMVEDFSSPLEILLRECLPSKLGYFNLNFPFNISMPQFVDILYWIKCNHNVDININIKMSHSNLSQCTSQYYFNNCLIDLFNLSKDCFKKRNLLTKYEIVGENSFKFIINKYNDKDIDYYYNFIYCFNKTNTINKNDSNQKIFQNIFNFRGKFKKYEIGVEINK